MRATALHTWLIMHAGGALALAQSRAAGTRAIPLHERPLEVTSRWAGSDMVALMAWVAAYRLG